MAFDRRRSFRHLHQRNHSLLLSGSSGTAEQDHRQFTSGRLLKGSGNLFSHSIAHACHHKSGIHHSKDCRHSAYGSLPYQNGFVEMCLFLQLPELFKIARILQGIAGFNSGEPFPKRTLVCQGTDPCLCLNPEISAAFRADVGVIANVLLINCIPAFRAFHP